MQDRTSQQGSSYQNPQRTWTQTKKPQRKVRSKRLTMETFWRISLTILRQAHTFLSSTLTAWLFLSDQELELVHARIGSLDSLRLYRFSGHLRKLCLRQNFISHLDSETLHQLTKLEELDLYDNKVKTVGDALDKLSSLTWVAPRVFQYPSWIFVRVLDLSFNLLRAVPDRLECLTSLQTIYFVQNKISKISGLSSCVTLRSLELGGNKIRVGLFLSVPLSFLNLNRKLNTSTHWST